MYTHTHLIMGVVLFGGKMRKRALAAAAGGLLPDLPSLLIVAGLKLAGIPAPLIHGVLYWQEWWQVPNAIVHGFWLWAGMFLAAFVLRERLSATAPAIDHYSLVMVFAASALLHVALDFLTLREDAHMSFWPVTRWKFMSPVSYHDPLHFGTYFGLAEAMLGLGLAAIVFRRFSGTWLGYGAILAMLIYAATAYLIVL